MKVVFLQDIPAQKAKQDDVREVADGFARNFLFPKKLAMPATATAISQALARQQRRAKEHESARVQAERFAGKLQALALEFTARASAGKLYGGIGAVEILKELARHGIHLEEKQLKLEHPIKMVGEHKVPVKLGEGMGAEIKVLVREEEL